MPPASGGARYATTGTDSTVSVEVSAETTDRHTTHQEIFRSLMK
jgi:hypothetical protein